MDWNQQKGSVNYYIEKESIEKFLTRSRRRLGGPNKHFWILSVLSSRLYGTNSLHCLLKWFPIAMVISENMQQWSYDTFFHNKKPKLLPFIPTRAENCRVQGFDLLHRTTISGQHVSWPVQWKCNILWWNQAKHTFAQVHNPHIIISGQGHDGMDRNRNGFPMRQLPL